jgi:glutamate dehydrogenase/leucine dehydrogenase
MIKQINAKKHPAYDGHEKVFYFEDKRTKLQGYIAWHNSKLGPLTGGTRLYPYKSKKEALGDVLSLSKAMSYKCAISHLPFGGGKAVIIGNVKLKNKNFLEAYAYVINSFNGKYTTGTDVNISDADIFIMSHITPYILRGDGGKRTTSQMAAKGVYVAIKKASKLILSKKENKNISVLVKGVGKLGGELVRLLTKDGMQVFIADINKKRASKLHDKYPQTEVVNFRNIHKIKADIFSPCAIGNEFTKKVVEELNCKIIIGGANNQLANDKLAENLQMRGIWYIPDYVVNSGGLIQIIDGLSKKGYNLKRVTSRINQIGETTKKLIKQSLDSGETPLFISGKIAQAKLNHEKRKKRKK